MRIVLDTNVVLDLVVFRDPGAEDLRSAIESKAVTLVGSAACIEELRRVLAYPRFRLSSSDQQAALDWFADRIEVAPDVEETSSALPRCRDPDDQKFLHLAWASGADHLVTKDRALLELAKRVAKLGRFLVSSPTDLPLRSP